MRSAHNADWGQYKGNYHVDVLSFWFSPLQTCIARVKFENIYAIIDDLGRFTVILIDLLEK